METAEIKEEPLELTICQDSQFGKETEDLNLNIAKELSENEIKGDMICQPEKEHLVEELDLKLTLKKENDAEYFECVYGDSDKILEEVSITAIKNEPNFTKDNSCDEMLNVHFEDMEGKNNDGADKHTERDEFGAFNNNIEAEITKIGKLVSCDLCDKNFNYRSELNRHMSSHTGQKDYVCLICLKEFNRKSRLITHLKMHTEDGNLLRLERWDLENTVLNHEGKNDVESYEKNIKINTNQSNQKEHGKNDCKTCLDVSALVEHEESRKEKIKNKGHHQCQICDQVFKFKYKLRRHQMIHKGEKNFLCSFCAKPFNRKDSLIKHIKLLHNESGVSNSDKEINCKIVRAEPKNNHVQSRVINQTKINSNDGKVYLDLNGLFNHENLAKEKVRNKGHHKCQVCNKVFKYKSHLDRHQFMHSGEKDFLCSFCGKNFNRKDRLSEHMKKQHKNLNIDIEMENKNGRSEVDNDARICEGFDLGNETDASGKKIKTLKNQCSFCNMTFVYKSGLNRHLLTHTGIKNFVCSICGREFSLKSRLVSHVRMHRKNLEDAQCEKAFSNSEINCQLSTEKNEKDMEIMNGSYQREGKTYLDLVGLEAHEKSVDESIKSRGHHECQFCHKVFKFKHKLIRHQVVHSGEKNFLCSFCGKSYNRKDHLAEHVRGHTNKEKAFIIDKTTGEKILGPETDTNVNSDKNAFHAAVDYNSQPITFNIRINTYKLNCIDEIDSRLIDTSVLTNNGENADDQKYHQCPFCIKKFKNKHDLNRHICTHTGQKDFVCSLCGKEFTRKHRLIKHLQWHKKKDSYLLSCGEEDKDKTISTNEGRNEMTDVSNQIGVEMRSVPNQKDAILGKTYLDLVQLVELEKSAKERIENRGHHECQICQKVFKFKYKLVRHQVTHSGEKNFLCSFCGKSYNRKDHLDKHIKQQCKKRNILMIEETTIEKNTFGGHGDQKESVEDGDESVASNIVNGFLNRYFEGLKSRNELMDNHERNNRLLNFNHESNIETNTVNYIKSELLGAKPVIENNYSHGSLIDFADEDLKDAFQDPDCVNIRDEEVKSSKESCCDDKGENSDIKGLFKRETINREEFKTYLKPHICSYCDKAFKNKCDLIRHMPVHTGERKFVCLLCKKAFTRKSRLVKHLQSHRRKLNCLSKEDELLNNEVEKEPKAEYDKKTFENKRCEEIDQQKEFNNDGKIYLGLDGLIEHEKSAEEKIMNKGHHECQMCKKVFKYKCKLHRHQGMRSIGANDESDASDSELNISNNEESTIKDKVKYHSCSHCCKKFKYKCQLNQHLSSHTKEKNYVCSICSKRFSRRCHLVSHVQLHKKGLNVLSSLNGVSEGEHLDLNGNSEQCDVDRIDLQNQDHEKNDGEKSSSNDGSGVVYLDLAGLAKYEKSREEKQKKKGRHECQFCGKMFKWESKLKVHEVIHTGEKKFICTTCGKSFGRKDRLREHLESHETFLKWLCTICGKRFRRKENLNVHWRRHTGVKPYMCNYCPKRFVIKAQLQNHVRIHTGEKPFKCATCGRPFRRKCQLRLHNRLHTGERPHICPLCGKRFIHTSGLNPHLKKHANPQAFSM